MEELLEPLVVDHHSHELKLYCMSDSSCVLSILNPAIALKNVLLYNAIADFKENLERISITFENTEIKICHIGGDINPSDSMTKLYADPIKVINSDNYRIGPSKFDSHASLSEDLVATVKNGTFEWLGLPEKFIPEKPERSDGSCNICQDFCGLVLTRSKKGKQEAEPMAKVVKEVTEKTKTQKEFQIEKLQKWWSRTREIYLHVGGGSNLLDPNYIPKCNFKLSKEKFTELKAKFFTFKKFFNAFCVIAARYWAKYLPNEK